MPIVVTIDERSRRVSARATGVVTLAEIFQLAATARAPVERREWALLFDARGATTEETEASVASLVERVKALVAAEGGPRGDVALVADDDQLFAICLLYETRLEEMGFRIARVFRQLGDAERWLDIMTSARRFR